MSKVVSFILGFILSAAVLGYLSMRAVGQETAGTSDVVPARGEVLQSDIAEKIKMREINGELPVKVLPENFGRDDPFASF